MSFLESDLTVETKVKPDSRKDMFNRPARGYSNTREDKAQGGAEGRDPFDLARIINESYPFDRECEVNI